MSNERVREVPEACFSQLSRSLPPSRVPGGLIAKRRRVKVLLLAVILPGLSAIPLACKIPQTRYYTINYPHTVGRSDQAPLPISLVIERFQGSDPFLSNRLIYRESANEINYYEYHRWASPPVDLATEALLHAFEVRGRFQDVHALRESESGDVILRGRLEHFEEVDQPALVARVALRVEAVDAKTHALKWSSHADVSQPVEVHTVSGVVEALQKALVAATEQLATQMESAFANYQAAAGKKD